MIVQLKDREDDETPAGDDGGLTGARERIAYLTDRISELKINERIDTLKNEIRGSGIAWGRWLYFALLGGIALAFLNFLFGPALFFRAEGLVLKKQHVIAMLYNARVKDVQIKEGDEVNMGDRLMRIESSNIIRQIAELSANVAGLTTKRGQIKARARASRAVLPIAREHANQVRLLLAGLDGLKKKSLVTGARLNEALGSRFTTGSRLARLEAEVSALDAELTDIDAAHAQAVDALDELKRLYNKGVVVSPVHGTVGPKIPSAGDVRIVGQEMFKLYSGKPFVLAYMPDRYIFSVDKGDRVKISAGSSSARGTIDAVLSVADALPPEFQNIFKPRDRSRLVKISLPSDAVFAVSQKVYVTGAWW